MSASWRPQSTAVSTSSGPGPQPVAQRSRRRCTRGPGRARCGSRRRRRPAGPRDGRAAWPPRPPAGSGCTAAGSANSVGIGALEDHGAAGGGVEGLVGLGVGARRRAARRSGSGRAAGRARTGSPATLAGTSLGGPRRPGSGRSVVTLTTRTVTLSGVLAGQGQVDQPVGGLGRRSARAGVPMRGGDLGDLVAARPRPTGRPSTARTCRPASVSWRTRSTCTIGSLPTRPGDHRPGRVVGRLLRGQQAGPQHLADPGVVVGELASRCRSRTR